MRVAYVHDWLVTYRGGEKVLEALASLYPAAPIYTLFYDASAMPPMIRARDVRWPKSLNLVRKLRKVMLPLLPRAIESLDLAAYDLLISTSSCVAKGAVKRPDAKHLCYIHSPMRYIWDQQEEYLKGVAHIPGAAAAIKAMTPSIRKWDVESAQRVDRFVANSSFVKERVERLYQRDASVVHPPIELDRFRPIAASGPRQGYLLAAGALVSYKRFDLAIDACARLGRRLVVAGSGPMERALRAQVESLGKAGHVVEFVLRPDDKTFTRLVQEAEGLLFPGIEDFGMIAIEAMACGTPVIAYQDGGARDFITEGETGVFFAESSVDSLAKALKEFDARAFDAQKLNQYAQRYDRKGFLDRIGSEIEALTGGAAR